MKLLSKEMLMSAVVTTAMIIAALAIYDRFIRERVVRPINRLPETSTVVEDSDDE
jgi:hypothetical protein